MRRVLKAGVHVPAVACMLKETYSPVGGPTPTEGCEFSNLPWSLKKCNYHFSKSQTILKLSTFLKISNIYKQ